MSRRCESARRVVASVFLVVTVATQTALGQVGSAAPRGTTPAPTEAIGGVDPGRGGISPSDVLASANAAIANARAQIAVVQAVAAMLGLMIGFAGIANIWVALRYGAQLRELRRVGRELGAHIQAVEAKLQEASEEGGKCAAEIRSIDARLSSWVEVVEDITVLNSGLGANPRLRALQRLSQRVDSLGVGELIRTIRDGNAGVALRTEAAYGLGRYADNPSFREFYPEIFAAFRAVLSTDSTPLNLAAQVIESVGRYRPAPEELRAVSARWRRPARKDTHSGDVAQDSPQQVHNRPATEIAAENGEDGSPVVE